MSNSRSNRWVVTCSLVTLPPLLASLGIVVWYPELVVSTTSEVTHLNWAFYLAVAVGTLAAFTIVKWPAGRLLGRGHVVSGLQGGLAAGAYAAMAFSTVATSPPGRALSVAIKTWVVVFCVGVVLAFLLAAWVAFELFTVRIRKIQRDRARRSGEKSGT